MSNHDPPHQPCLGDRRFFPQLTAQVYANHAAISPLSKPVTEAIFEVVTAVSALGSAVYPDLFERRISLKAQLGRLFNVSPNDFALTDNTTSGVSAVALGFPWQFGDGVVLFEGEFPTNVTPWLMASKQFGLKPRLLPAIHDHGTCLESLEACLRGGEVRLVAVSWVQFQTGVAVPVHEMADLCHRYGAHLFVDGIQACGILPIAFGDVDFVACGGHKWLMGPEGTGFLFANSKTAPTLRPLVAGWLSHQRPVDFLFEGPNRLKYDKPMRPGVGFLERGSMNAAGLAGLDAALSLILAIGPKAIFKHITAWHDAAETLLVNHGFESVRSIEKTARSGILAFAPNARMPAVDFAAVLHMEGITVGTPDGYLRLSPHWPNHLDEISRFEDALGGMKSTQR